MFVLLLNDILLIQIALECVFSFSLHKGLVLLNIINFFVYVYILYETRNS